MATSPPSPTSFSDFPEDVQLTILSFLRPAEIATFACTSRRFSSLCAEAKLWFSMCDRRWGSKTLIRKWAGAAPGELAGEEIPFAMLYKTLDGWEDLIGFWRRIGQGSAPGNPPLVFFEWGPSFITGSRVSPTPEAGSYSVAKIPFLWMGLSPAGEPVSFLHRQFDSPADFAKTASGSSGSADSDLNLMPVTVSFLGGYHFVVEENQSYYYAETRGDDGSSDDLVSLEGSSPPDRLMSEIYQYFANRTSPGGDKGSRRHRKKKERERLGKRRWEPEHFVKIVNCYPTPSRPLQGLWKGICQNMNLDFYLVTYDDIGGISCRRIGDALEPFSGYSPVFWTTNTAFLEHPFPGGEEDIYDSREHIRPIALNCMETEREVVSRILHINSSYDLVIPDLSDSSINPQNVEGRIWGYKSGIFGFGFLRDNFIVDLKHIASDGYLLDTIEYCCKGSSL